MIDGQKVWTSIAHFAQWCFVVARTEPGSKRHEGLSFLLVPLDQHGVEVRPIEQLTGGSEFNEVFFDDARTDADLVVGEPGDGWRVAMGLLTFERGVSRSWASWSVTRVSFPASSQLARENGAIDDPVIRDRLTRAWVELRAMRSYALATWMSSGPARTDRVEAGVGQLARGSARSPWTCWARTAWPADGEAADLDEWQRLFLFSRSDTIYGGCNEIQRNILAERVLGLPREVKG